MATATTHWKPDTCPCEFDYTWDTTSNPNTRIHTLLSATSCSFHSAAPTALGLFGIVGAENSHKNTVIAAIGTIVGTAQSITWDYGTATGTHRTLNIGIPGGAIATITNVTTAIATLTTQPIVVSTASLTNLGPH